MLERIHIQGFKSLRDVEVELAPLTVVFGPNAAGKSNFLEALMLLAGLARGDVARAFESSIRGYPLEAFSLPLGGMEALIQQTDDARLSLDARVRLTDVDQILYRIVAGIGPKSGALYAADEDIWRVTSGSAQPTTPGVERLVLNEMLSAWRLVHLDPREAMRRPQPPRDTDGIGERGELLVPFLHRLAHKHPKAFAAVLRGVQAIIPSVEAITTELVPSRGEIDLKVKQDGTWYSARVLSEGTLRVMAVCAMAAAPNATGLLAFEEPENGVHPRRIEVITSMLAHAARKRQVILTTHSPLVVGQVCRLTREGELAPEQVRLLRCSAGPEGTKLRPFDPLPVLDDAEIRAALAGTDDSDLIQAMLVRGWLE